jgi:predicted Zn-dependent protease with MMP-like domain
MQREDFVKIAEETLDSLPEEFRSRIQNVAILVEDFPAKQPPPKLGQHRRLPLARHLSRGASNAEEGL